MDNELSLRLKEIHDQILTLEGAERSFFSLEASEKPLYSRLFLQSEGKNIPEREAMAYTQSRLDLVLQGIRRIKDRIS